MFLEFISTHNKQYSTQQEFDQRFQIFSENHDMITSHNEKETGYKMGHNLFSDLSEDEFLEIYAQEQPT